MNRVDFSLVLQHSLRSNANIHSPKTKLSELINPLKSKGKRGKWITFNILQLHARRQVVQFRVDFILPVPTSSYGITDENEKPPSNEMKWPKVPRFPYPCPIFHPTKYHPREKAAAAADDRHIALFFRISRNEDTCAEWITQLSLLSPAGPLPHILISFTRMVSHTLTHFNLLQTVRVAFTTTIYPSDRMQFAMQFSFPFYT